MTHRTPDPRLKYSRLADDLRAALALGRQAERDETESNDVPNADAPSLFLPSWQGASIREAARLAGTTAAPVIHRDVKSWVFEPDTESNGSRRTVNAEAMAHELRRRGYLASIERKEIK